MLFDIVKTLVAVAAGYLLGSINSSVIVARLYGVDIREHGSKSAGLTNALRVLGKLPAAMVLIGDVGKGITACLIGSYLGVYSQYGNTSDCISLLAAGMGAVVGHNWPLYFNFRGGKGALTAAAVMFMISWPSALVSVFLFMTIVALTRYVSLGTISSTIFFVMFSMLPPFHNGPYFFVVSLILASIIVWKHRANIQRLRAGTEAKLHF